MDEAGLPGLHISLWYGLWVPAGTPPEIVAKLNAAVMDAQADPATRARLAELELQFPRATNKPRRRCVPCKKPRSTSGGRS